MEFDSSFFREMDQKDWNNMRWQWTHNRSSQECLLVYCLDARVSVLKDLDIEFLRDVGGRGVCRTSEDNARRCMYWHVMIEDIHVVGAEVHLVHFAIASLKGRPSDVSQAIIWLIYGFISYAQITIIYRTEGKHP